MTQAGGKLSLELYKKFAEFSLEKGKKFVVIYGQCKATARMLYLPPERSLERYGYIGIVIPDVRFTSFRVIRLDEIPKSDAGKVQYRELEKLISLL